MTRCWHFHDYHCTQDAGFVSCFVHLEWTSLEFLYLCITYPPCRCCSWIQKMHRGHKRCVDQKDEGLSLAHRHFGTTYLILFKVLSSWASLRSIYHRRSAEGQGRESGTIQRWILHGTTALVAKHQESQKEEDTIRCLWEYVASSLLGLQSEPWEDKAGEFLCTVPSSQRTESDSWQQLWGKKTD